jgi:2-polyprenyl-3-methyl-5-hydroxy-6-metoxy-1,4-benzoquinol methylase
MDMTIASEPWPDRDLETVPNCPVCNAEAAGLLYADLRDVCFGAAPGAWRLCQCSGCGTVRLDPRPTADSIARAYSRYYTHSSPDARKRSLLSRALHRIADGYLGAAYGLPRRTLLFASLACKLLWPLRGFLDGTMRHLPQGRTPGRLLDVGCGHGAFLQLAREAGWTVRGVDFDPAAVATAQASGLDVACGPVSVLPLSDPPSDYITLSHVIEHVHDPLALLQEIFLRLKPGGQVWIETPSVDALGHARFGRHWRGLEVPRHLVLFNESGLRLLLLQAGFVDIERLYRGPIAPLTYAESEALAVGLPLGSFRVAQRGRAALVWDSLKQECLPARREFLTLRARRPS